MAYDQQSKPQQNRQDEGREQLLCESISDRDTDLVRLESPRMWDYSSSLTADVVGA